MEKLLKLRDEMKEDLLHGSIFPFWEQYTIDHENGGFYGAVTVDKVIHKDASKGLVLNARLLWTFAGAYRIFGDEKYKELADRAFNYIVSASGTTKTAVVSGCCMQTALWKTTRK